MLYMLLYLQQQLPSTIWIASNGQAFTQEPYPKTSIVTCLSVHRLHHVHHRCTIVHSSDTRIPVCALSQVPAHFTNATSCTCAPASYAHDCTNLCCNRSSTDRTCLQLQLRLLQLQLQVRNILHIHNHHSCFQAVLSRIASSLSSTSTANFLPGNSKEHTDE